MGGRRLAGERKRVRERDCKVRRLAQEAHGWHRSRTGPKKEKTERLARVQQEREEGGRKGTLGSPLFLWELVFGDG